MPHGYTPPLDRQIARLIEIAEHALAQPKLPPAAGEADTIGAHSVDRIFIADGHERLRPAMQDLYRLIAKLDDDHKRQVYETVSELIECAVEIAGYALTPAETTLIQLHHDRHRTAPARERALKVLKEKFRTDHTHADIDTVFAAHPGWRGKQVQTEVERRLGWKVSLSIISRRRSAETARIVGEIRQAHPGWPLEALRAEAEKQLGRKILPAELKRHLAKLAH
jgi:hypothetical protein